MWSYTWRALTLAILLGGWLVAHAETVHLVRMVKLPDGKPAVGVTVLARTFQYEESTNFNNPTPTLLREYRFATDKQGRLAVDIPTAYSKEMGVVSLVGYLLLEKPGYAPAISAFTGPGSDPTIILEPAYTLTGTVVDTDKHPVPHATVTVHLLESQMVQGVLVLNQAAKGIVTPAFTTVTDETGAFTLPGLAAGYNPVRAYVSASATLKGLTLVGWTSQITFLRTIPPDAFHGPVPHIPTGWGNPFTPAVITVLPALQVQGTVTDAVSGQPLPGAAVSAVGEPAWQFGNVKPVTTDATGHYMLEGIPASVTKLLIVAAHKGYAPERGKAAGLHVGTADAPGTMSETPVAISLRPLVTVTGTVTDKVTHRPPSAPFTLRAYYDDGVDTIPFSMTADGTDPWLPPTAPFSVQLPAGKTRLEAQVAAGSGFGMLDLTIPPTGLTDQRLEAWRSDGIFVQVVPNGVSMANVDVRVGVLSKPGTYMWTGSDHGYWFFPVERGIKVKVQVLRVTTDPYREQPLSPWVGLMANQSLQDWPHVITLQKTPTSGHR